jgi:hypothetical protein
MALKGYHTSEESILSKRPLQKSSKSLTSTKWYLETYFDLLKICDSFINVPSIILETIHSEPNIETRKRANLCDERSLRFRLSWFADQHLKVAKIRR